MSQKSDYYVYVLFRETGVPFYVGKGRGRRFDQHECDSRQPHSHRTRLIRHVVSRIGELPRVKLHEHLTNDQACDYEIALISAIGREPIGTLINQTRGGDGVIDLPKATRVSIGQQVSIALKGRPRPPDVIAKIRATHLAMKKVISKEQREKISASLIGRPGKHYQRPKGFRHSAEAKAKMAAANAGRKLSLDIRRKISTALTGRSLSPEHRRSISVGMARRHENS